VPGPGPLPRAHLWHIIFRSDDRPVITGGVDTHAEIHVAAALDPIGGLLGVREFPATAAGYADC